MSSHDEGSPLSGSRTPGSDVEVSNGRGKGRTVPSRQSRSGYESLSVHRFLSRPPTPDTSPTGPLPPVQNPTPSIFELVCSSTTRIEETPPKDGYDFDPSPHRWWDRTSTSVMHPQK